MFLFNDNKDNIFKKLLIKIILKYGYQKNEKYVNLLKRKFIPKIILMNLLEEKK